MIIFLALLVNDVLRFKQRPAVAVDINNRGVICQREDETAAQVKKPEP
jgi:hypothetical protein